MVRNCKGPILGKDSNLPARAAALTIGHNTAASKLTELGELTLEPILINVPRQVTNEQVGGSTLRGLLGLGLLSRGSRLLISLALLGSLGGILAILGLRLRAVRVRIGRLL